MRVTVASTPVLLTDVTVFSNWLSLFESVSSWSTRTTVLSPWNTVSFLPSIVSSSSWVMSRMVVANGSKNAEDGGGGGIRFAVTMS